MNGDVIDLFNRKLLAGLDELTASDIAKRAVQAPESWFNTRPPPRRYLLRDGRRTGNPGVVPLGKVGLLIGEGGVSKTMATVQLALSVAHGQRWLGTFDVATPGKVLVVLGEEDQEECHRRLYYAARSAHLGPTTNITFLPLAGEPTALIGEGGETPDCVALRDVTRALEPVLVIFDPLSRFAGPDAETDNAAATRFMQLVETFAKLGPTVLVAHHTAKPSRGGGPVGTAASRGSSALTDGARFVCSLANAEHKGLQDGDRERLENTVLLAFGKSNYTRKADALELRRCADNMGALVPLDEDDLATVGAVAGTTDKAAKRASDTRTRLDSLDAAVVRLVANQPGKLSRSAAKALIRQSEACSNQLAWDAIERCIAVGKIRTQYDEGGALIPL